MKISRKKGAKKRCLKPSINRGRGRVWKLKFRRPPTGFCNLQMDSPGKDCELHCLGSGHD